MPKRLAIADCETDPFKEGRVPQPFIWGLFFPDTQEFHHFDTLDEMMCFIQDDDLRVYFHNGGKFDFHYMLEYIPSWAKIIMINGRIAQWRVNKLEFVDSYCILPVPLSAYNKTEIDYEIMEQDKRNIPTNRSTIIAYLRDDCRFLSDLITAFMDDNGYSLTVASCAIKRLQKIENIKIEDSGRTFFDEMRPYFYGGRVECFQKGIIKGNIQYFDINSAYPYAMTHEHPFGEFITNQDKNPELKGHNFYKIQSNSLGVFPFRNKDGTLTFPNDGNNRIFCVTGWEILEALNIFPAHDLNILHIEQKIFYQTKNFARYVAYFYHLKQNSPKDSPQYIFAKLFLNAAYGKFAANPEKYRATYLIPLEDFESANKQGYTIHSELHDRYVISKENPKEKWRHYNVATGASITGFVRAYLLRALHNVESPLYCDTDSIIFTGAHNLKIGENLGEWGKVGEFHEGGIGGKKIYAFRNKKYYDISPNDKSKEAKKLRSKYEKTACKGARLDYDKIIKVAKKEKITETSIVPVYSIKKGIYFATKTIAMT